MKKMLSHIVILLLLVIAPVSFSTEKIPNFDKPATQSSPLQESRKSIISVVHQSIKPVLPVIVRYTHTLFASVQKNSVHDCCVGNHQGRAPPVVHSV